jgi:hypothetical protein
LFDSIQKGSNGFTVEMPLRCMPVDAEVLS